MLTTSCAVLCRLVCRAIVFGVAFAGPPNAQTIGEEIPAADRRTPEYFSKFVAGEIARWSGPIKASGVTVE